VEKKRTIRTVIAQSAQSAPSAPDVLPAAKRPVPPPVAAGINPAGEGERGSFSAFTTPLHPYYTPTTPLTTPA